MVNIFFTLLLKFTDVFHHFDIVRCINRYSLIGDFYKKNLLFHVLKSHNILFQITTALYNVLLFTLAFMYISESLRSTSTPCAIFLHSEGEWLRFDGSIRTEHKTHNLVKQSEGGWGESFPCSAFDMWKCFTSANPPERGKRIEC